MKISHTLKKLRQEKNLSQKELGAKIGISDKVISKWERGESLPKIDDLMKLSTFYSISIDELLLQNKKALEMPFEKQRVTPTVSFWVIMALSIVVLIFETLWFVITFIKNNGKGTFAKANGSIIGDISLFPGFAIITLAIVTFCVFCAICFVKIDFRILLFQQKIGSKQIREWRISKLNITKSYKIVGICYAVINLIFQLNFFVSILFLNLLIVKPYYVTISAAFLSIIMPVLCILITILIVNKICRNEVKEAL